MKVRKFSKADAPFERSPGQDADIDVGNLVDEHDGSPITIGYGRYGPNSTLTDDIVVDDVMIVLEGRLSVTAGSETMTAGPGDIVHLAKDNRVTIRAHEDGAITAYVTYPNWRAPDA